MAEDWRAVWPSVVRDAETAGGYSPWINTRAQARAILAADAALKVVEGKLRDVWAHACALQAGGGLTELDRILVDRIVALARQEAKDG